MLAVGGGNPRLFKAGPVSYPLRGQAELGWHSMISQGVRRAIGQSALGVGLAILCLALDMRMLGMVTLGSAAIWLGVALYRASK
jgi:hypothetical protein